MSANNKNKMDANSLGFRKSGDRNSKNKVQRSSSPKIKFDQMQRDLDPNPNAAKSLQKINAQV